MYRQLLVLFTVALLIHDGRTQLNPFQIYAIRFREYAAKIMPESITHDLMGNPFHTINQILSDGNIKSCTKHLLDYVKHPSSPKVPKCVNKEDLKAIDAALDATWNLPSQVGSECKDVLSGNVDVLKKCTHVTSGKANQITKSIGKALQNINKSCGKYIRDNQQNIVKYYKGGCKGDFQPKVD